MASCPAVVLGAMFCLQGTAATNAPTASAVEKLVREWVDLRSDIAAEKRGWQTTEAQLTEEIRLLEKEKAELENELSKSETLNTSRRTEQAGLTEKKTADAQALDALRVPLDRAEANFRQWRDRIPPALAAPLSDLFADIPATQAEAQKRSVAARAQTVVALYTQIETLQNSFHAVRDVLTVDPPTRREVDVLYIGLARGFAVSPDRSWAGVGTPATNGWTWRAHPELASEIETAIRIFRRDKPAALVHLPLSVPTNVPTNGPPGAQEWK